MRALAALLAAGLAAAAEPSLVDYKKPVPDGATLVGMECHTRKQTLELGYFDASNPPLKRMDLWDVTLMVSINPKTEMVEKVMHVERTCSLAPDKYRVRFTAVPGNANIQGRCGASTFANAKVWKNGALLFDRDLEECSGKQVIRSVTFERGSDQPRIHAVDGY